MAEKITKQETEYTEDDFYAAAVSARTGGLMELLSRISPNLKTEEMLGTNGFPFIRIGFQNDEINMAYYPVGSPDDGRFILFIKCTVFIPDEADPTLAIDCESFNFGSSFGYAVYDPTDGSVELRAQVPETGGILDSEYYENILDLFLYSVDDLRETIAG